MAQHEVRFSEDFDAPRAKVFALFASHEKFGAAATGPIGVRLGLLRRVRSGDDPAQPDGVGSVRRIGFGPTAFEETVLVSEPPSLIEYRISKGSPLKNHHGRIAFSDLPDGGTHVDYRIVFEPRVPGTAGLLSAVLRGLIAPAFPRMRKTLAG
jgi:uncharacterized protein YndB with AHSA1/START domain